MNKEIWKDIEGYEELYQISNFGNVKSLPKKVRYTNRYGSICYRLTNERILKPVINCWGYCSVTLFKNKTRNSQRVHRLVAYAFIDNPLNKPEVNHIDGNKQNNCVENLEWCTSHENGIHAWKIGLFNSSCRESCRENLKKAVEKSKIKVNQFDLNGNFIQTWNSAKDVERKLKINSSHITHCCKKQRKTAGGFKWSYCD